MNSREFMKEHKKIMKKLTYPKEKYCPYCASENLKYYNDVPRCMNCRKTFFVTFGRHIRKPPTKKEL